MSTTAMQVYLDGDELAVMRRLAELAVIDAAGAMFQPTQEAVEMGSVQLDHMCHLYNVTRAHAALDSTSAPEAHYWPLDQAMVAALRKSAEWLAEVGEMAEGDDELVERGLHAQRALTAIDVLEKAE